MLGKKAQRRKGTIMRRFKRERDLTDPHDVKLVDSLPPARYF